MKGREPDLRLRDGSHIVIVGAGPAGTFFAHYARKLSRELGIAVRITICDGKNFARQGPIGCNMCAGVIAAPLAQQLTAQGFLLPDERVQRRIEGYYVQTSVGGFLLDHPSGKRSIHTVFRGNGPRFTAPHGNVSFDDFLLDSVKAEGISTMVSSPMQEIRLPGDPREPISLTYGDQGGRTELRADLVVGAFGLNTAIMEKVQGLGFGYEPPLSRRVCQAELAVGREWIEGRLQNRIVVLALRIGAVTLAVFTPKADHVTLTLMGHEDMKRSDLEAFLVHPKVRDLLPPDWALPDNFCHCFPRLAVTAAKRPFTDRLVLIGDASFSRYYKNGIESALVTAQLAAVAAFRCGVSASCFEKQYLKPANRRIVLDNRFGRLLFQLPDLLAEHATLAEAQQRVVSADPPGYTGRALQRCLWNVLTGDVPYRSIFWQMCNPRLWGRMSITVLTIYWERLLRRMRRRRLASRV